MAPSKKSKSAKKRLTSLDDVSPDKADGRKKKLSDKLGSQWSNEELELFYKGYRKHGKDWKKVAAVVRNRSIEMVEALYNMNRAYLSLPEGTASVVGLIAMMTDHYNVLEGSDSERESNDASGMSWKPQKRRRGKEDLLLSQSITSSDGCLSLLKRRRLDGCGPHAVRKRTPRFPVSYSYKKDDREINVLVNKRGRNSEDANDDEVAHAAALTLTEASQRGGSPQVSKVQYRRTKQIKSSPIEGWERMHPQSETAQAKLRYPVVSEEWLEGSIGRREAENGDYGRDTSSLMDMEGVGTVEIHRWGKKSYEKKVKVEDFGNNQCDEGGEACSGTEGVSVSLKGKLDIDFSNAKIEQLSPQGKRKRTKKLYFGDESTALDALQTLVDLSLTMPASIIESESSAQLKEERTNVDRDDKSSVPEATSTSHHRDKIKIPGPKEKAFNSITKVEGISSRKSKLGRGSTLDIKVTSEAKQQQQSPNSIWKRKRKSLGSKISNSRAHKDSHLTGPMDIEILAEEENRSVIKGKRTGLISAPSKQSKWVRGLESSSFNSDQKSSVIDLALSTAEAPAANQVSLPTMHRSRRKMDLKRVFISKEMKSSENTLKNRSSKGSSSLEEKALCLKEMLSFCLSSCLARRWCTFEWFYSAIDYPWFAKSEFVEYLNHVGLGHIPRLTRVEWGVIRSSLGKPRRFSEYFLHIEREKLKQYRESVRIHYTELRTGIREGLPKDLARPLSVGQRVIALHPKTREVYDGSVLTVDRDKCRVQFDRPELGVEFVMDIDCMPLNLLDNMPEALRRQIIAVDKSSVISRELQGDTNHASFQCKGAVDIVSAQAAYNQPCTVAHIQAKEADVQAVSVLTRALDKKEALLRELRYTNDDVLANQNDGDSFLRDSEPFKKHYATVLVQLKEANGQVSSALLQLRQHNTYPGNPLPPWLKPPVNSSVPDVSPSYLDDALISQETESSVAEIVKGSRFKAHTMVDAAVQAMLSTKEGEDAFMRIGEALDSVDNPQLTSDSRGSVLKNTGHVNGSVSNHSQLISGTSEPPLSTYAPSPKLHDGSDQNEAQIPSELITSCVATLLMIQTCTERQFPPADVAQILDSAVTSLHPCCNQNLPIYREIQMCMGRIKTQILALIPT